MTDIQHCISLGFSSGTVVKYLPANAGDTEMQAGSLGKKSPWHRKWQPDPVFLPGKFHGHRSLASCSPWGRKELDMTEHPSALTHTHTHTHTCRDSKSLWYTAWWSDLHPLINIYHKFIHKFSEHPSSHVDRKLKKQKKYFLLVMRALVIDRDLSIWLLHFIYPFICWWALRLFPYLGYCK